MRGVPSVCTLTVLLAVATLSSVSPGVTAPEVGDMVSVVGLTLRVYNDFMAAARVWAIPTDKSLFEVDVNVLREFLGSRLREMLGVRRVSYERIWKANYGFVYYDRGRVVYEAWFSLFDCSNFNAPKGLLLIRDPPVSKGRHVSILIVLSQLDVYSVERGILLELGEGASGEPIVMVPAGNRTGLLLALNESFRYLVYGSDVKLYGEEITYKIWFKERVNVSVKGLPPNATVNVYVNTWPELSLNASHSKELYLREGDIVTVDKEVLVNRRPYICTNYRIVFRRGMKRLVFNYSPGG